MSTRGRSGPTPPFSRRVFLGQSTVAAAALLLPELCRTPRVLDPDRERLKAWTATLRREHLARAEASAGSAAARVGELARGTPYVAGTLDRYLADGGAAVPEPLTLSLTEFDCVTLVESCLAVARTARAAGDPAWEDFARQVELMRYRGGSRAGYTSRLHYFSEWIRDGAARGLVRDLGRELEGVADTRPLRFMTQHRDSYPALRDDDVFREIAGMEQRLDAVPRWLVPVDRIAVVEDRIRTGDVLAFATGIPGLDVTHAAFAYRDPGGILRVLHAPLSGGVVEITRSTLPAYVTAIRRATGILVARPLPA